MAIHSSILAWRIPWTEEPGGLQSMESQRVGHDWVTSAFTFRFLEARRLKSRGWQGCAPSRGSRREMSSFLRASGDPRWCFACGHVTCPLHHSLLLSSLSLDRESMFVYMHASIILLWDHVLFFLFLIHHSLQKTRYYHYLNFIDMKTGAFWSQTAKDELGFKHRFFCALRSQLLTIKLYCFQASKIYRDPNYRAKAIASFKT